MSGSIANTSLSSGKTRSAKVLDGSQVLLLSIQRTRGSPKDPRWEAVQKRSRITSCAIDPLSELGPVVSGHESYGPPALLLKRQSPERVGTSSG